MRQQLPLPTHCLNLLIKHLKSSIFSCHYPIRQKRFIVLFPEVSPSLVWFCPYKDERASQRMKMHARNSTSRARSPDRRSRTSRERSKRFLPGTNSKRRGREDASAFLRVYFERPYRFRETARTLAREIV